MEMHHKLRRDPNWHPNACNLCGQLGHQAANCTSGTVNWRAIYGDAAFILKEPIYFSDEVSLRKSRQVDHEDLKKRAIEYAKKQAAGQGLDYEDIARKAEELNNTDPALLIKRMEPMAVDEEPLPPGWASAPDPQGRVYFYHKKTQKTQWDRPTADTPIS